jgi:DNA-binding YbaB/EbfC family protein
MPRGISNQLDVTQWPLLVLPGQFAIAIHDDGTKISLFFQPLRIMAGLGKMLKQAAKVQKQIEALQGELEKREIEVSSGGGAVKIKVNGQGKFVALLLDPEFLKEDAKLVSDTVLSAVQEAAAKAKALNESEMQKVTAAFQMPGMF